MKENMAIWPRMCAAALFLFAGVAPAFQDIDAPPDRFAVRRWGLEEGLPQSSVTAILHARDGFLWVGTFGGLARFDGRIFRSVPSSGSTIPPLARVLCLHEGPTGTIWVGAEGAGLLQVANGRLAAPEGPHRLPATTVTTVLEEPGGRLWIGTLEGLFCYSDGRLIRWGPEEGVGPDIISKLILRPGGGVLVQFGDRMVELYGTDRLQPIHIWNGSEAVDVLDEFDGSRLVVDVWGGLQRITPHGFLWLRPPPSVAGWARSFLVRDARGQVWALLRRDGLFLVEESGVRPVECPEIIGMDFRSMASDREGGLWLGLDGGGLVQLLPASFRVLGRAEGLPEDIVRPVAQAADGSIWAGVGCSGLVRWDGHRIERIGLRSVGGLDPCIFSIWPRRDGSLVAADYDSHIWILRGNDIVLHPSSPKENPTALLEDREGVLWLGTRRRGVERLEGSWPRSFRAADGLPSDEVATLMEDEAGRILVGTAAGVGIIDGDKVAPLEASGEPMLRSVRALLREGPRLWIGSYGDGLGVVENGVHFRFRDVHGLHEEVVSFIRADRFGFLWWTGNRGIYRARIDDLSATARRGTGMVAVRRFGRADGLASIETNGGFLPAGWETRDGRLIFPTTMGIVVADPAGIALQPPPPIPLLEKVVLDGGDVSEELGRVKIPPGTKRIEITLAAPTFHSPEHLRFLKRLDGFDTDWGERSDSNVSVFTGLSAGEYALLVRTVNSAGEMSPIVRIVAIEVLPRFYERFWFHAFFVLAVLAGIAGIVTLRQRSLRRRNVLLSGLVAQQTSELAEANTRLEKMAETDDLTGLANPRRFRGYLEKTFMQPENQGTTISLVMVDVDHFKEYNDSQGHLAGDTCLRRIALQLAASLYKPDDLAARMGGDEFGVVMIGVDHRTAMATAERIRTAVERLEIPHPESRTIPHVTISAGSATVKISSREGIDELLSAADSSLYRAKRAGRNRVGS